MHTSSQETQDVLTSYTGLLLEMVVYQEANHWCQPPREDFFKHMHGLSHTGGRATWRVVVTRFVWPGQAADVVSWCKEWEWEWAPDKQDKVFSNSVSISPRY